MIVTDGTPAPVSVIPPDTCTRALRTIYEELIDAALGDPHTVVPRPLDEVPLVCAISQKAFVNPLSVDMQIVNQGVLVLRQIGELYRPTADRPLPTVEEINRYKLEELMRISSHCRALLLPKFGMKSLALLYVERLSVLDDSSPLDLALVGRNFAGAIRCANETDLVTRGPLDLRATGVIPPQIVLDNKVCD